MIGKRFRRWLVLEKDPVKQDYWLSRCDCGTLKSVSGASMRSGGTQSCGCFRSERAAETRARHGQSRVGKITPTYRSWMLMNRRCNNPNDHDYPQYGGRGIVICDRWALFENFMADMGERPSGTTLDRRDGTKGYSPENCRWAVPSEQSLNRKSTKWITHDGLTLCIKQWAQYLGVNRGTISKRLARGKGVDGKEARNG